MTNYAVGHLAEEYAVRYLLDHGFAVVALNWRTRYCEIDVIAQKFKQLYFVEVKYRKDDFQGRGLDYITPKKLRRMYFAAHLWLSEHSWTGDYHLSALEISGPDFQITNFLPDCT